MQAFTVNPPIEAHGVIGDRRTAALVAADGTIDWQCLPDYDGATVFGCLLDAHQGGYWRMGPLEPSLGAQSYLDASAVLQTRWETTSGTLELTDFMPDPADERPIGLANSRLVLRRLRCTAGRVNGVMRFAPRPDFKPAATPWRGDRTVHVDVDRDGLSLWCSAPLSLDGDGVTARFELDASHEVWCVLGWDVDLESWSIARCEAALDETLAYWQRYRRTLKADGPYQPLLERSAIVAHLLTYAPRGSQVAAPTSSLPERLGGDLNWDYRFCWVRDSSLMMAGQLLLGDLEGPRRFLDWLVTLHGEGEAPLQICYHVDGRTRLAQQIHDELEGYRHSQPVRFGNRASNQVQFDSPGYLADLAWLYLERGGTWRPEYWDLIRRYADYVARHWQEADSGIWELPTTAHYTSSRVMSWVALDRASRIAERLGRTEESAGWQRTREAIHASVLEQGWSETLGAFKQSFETEALDASVLLIGLTGFLPPDDPRFAATIDRVAEQLTIDGWVHRFQAERTPGVTHLPVGRFEGAFLPCTFWLAQAYAVTGRQAEARRLLDQAAQVAGPLGLFSEELDARTRQYLGNTPQLFSHVGFVRAALQLAA